MPHYSNIRYPNERGYTKVQYWVKDNQGAVLGMFEEDALLSARQHAKSASGHVYEVILDLTLEGNYVVLESEV